MTQTIVNEYIRKIVIHAPDKSSGKRRQKVEIIFNFVDKVEISVLAEPMVAENRRDLYGHAVFCPDRKASGLLSFLPYYFHYFALFIRVQKGVCI